MTARWQEIHHSIEFRAVSRNESPAGTSVFVTQRGFSLLGQFGLVLRVPSTRRNEPVVKINAAFGTNYSIWMI